ncbi:hypothetical protein M2322_004164 [Rhodoblastus acidophilus]|nr:hypothetical protein [Rhodoblastus acidophilus]
MIVNFPRKGDLRRPLGRSAFAGAAKPRLICRWIRDTGSGRLIARWISETDEADLQGAEPPSPRLRCAA